MDTRSDVLWRVNNEYRKRLSQAQTYLDLLEQIVLANGDASQYQLVELLRYVRDQVNQLIEEHRNWRYLFYYESPETKRMVQGDRAVSQALARFSRMRSSHQSRLNDLYDLLDQAPRPDPRVTRVPTGDLWAMTEYALSNLLGFGDYLNSLEPVI